MCDRPQLLTDPLHGPLCHVGRKTGRKLFARGRFDGVKDVRLPAAVKAARHSLRRYMYSDRRECLGKHCAGNRLAIDEYAIAVEDNHRVPRCPGRKGGAVPPATQDSTP